MQKQLFCISTSLAREMGMTLTHDVTGRQLPLVTAPACELGDGLLHTTGPRLLGLTMAAQKGRKCGSAGGCSPLWEESEMGLGGRSTPV